MADGAGAVLGRWLRRARAEAGLTQQELAERSGLSVQTVGNIERGQSRRPYPSSVRRLAAALGVPESARDELIARHRGQSGPPSPPPSPSGREEEGAPGQRGDRQHDAHPPRQLPAGVRRFVGRDGELGRLSALPGETGAGAVVAVITGMAGVGKTALAVHWAHRAAARFPDGQIYVNLHGFAPSGRPVPPREAVRGFLDAFGVPPERVPASLEAQAGLFRGLLAGRRVLVVLDNARDSEQVRPLLPGVPGCLVLVTSRSPLAGLVAAEDACLVGLDVLPEAEARELLGYRLEAGRVEAEPAVIGELAGLCARLPLALSAVAARAAGRPGQPLAALAAGLRDARRRLDTLDTADAATAVRAVFSWSLRQLSEPAARMFRLLGIHSGPDISLPAAASLAGLPAGQAQSALDELAGAHLLAEHRAGRYAFHDLLRAYAAEQCGTTDLDAERRAATGRVLDHYVLTGYAARELLLTRVELVSPLPSRPPLAPGVIPEDLDSQARALAWFRTERQVLIAAAAQAAADGFDGHALRIPLLLRRFLGCSGYLRDAVTTGLIAVAAARRLGDPAAQALACRELGGTYNRVGVPRKADIHLREALILYQRIGDPRGQGETHDSLHSMFLPQQKYADALHHAEQALEQYRTAGYPAGEAVALNNLAMSRIALGHIQQALPLLRQALDFQSGAGASIDLAATLDTLGDAHHLLGQHRRAIACYRQAGNLCREFGDRPNLAAILHRLGDAHQAAGHSRAARQAWQQALDILTDLHHPRAADVRAKLAG